MPTVGHNLSRYFAAFNIRRTNFDICAITNHHDFVEINCFASFRFDFFKPKDFTWFDSVLLATTFYYSVHIFNPND